MSLLLDEATGELLDPARSVTPFEAFGLEPAYPLCVMSLQKRLRALSRQMHPDFFGAAGGEQRALAERNTAELNAAFEVLADDFQRAAWLVRELGGPSEEEERQMPQAFLMEVLEWNEALEQARGGDAEALERLAPLRRELQAEREAGMAAVGELLDPLPEAGAPVLTEVRRRLNAVRYLDRTLAELRELTPTA